MKLGFNLKRVRRSWKQAAFPFILLVSLTWAPAAVLTNAPVAACLPGAADYTFLYWANGWLKGAPQEPALLHLQTGRYGMVFDPGKAAILKLGEISNPRPYAEAASGRDEQVAQLPAAKLEMTVGLGTNIYRCVSAAGNRKDRMNFPVRIIESGRFVQRFDVLQLEFATPGGDWLAADARLEITAWPDSLQLWLELTPKHDFGQATLSMALQHQSSGRKQRARQEIKQGLGSNAPVSLALSIPFDGAESDAAKLVRVSAESIEQSAVKLNVDPDPVHAWHRILLPRKRWSVADEPDRLERFKVVLENPTDETQTFRLLFDDPSGTPGITGFTPMLRDTDGCPTGIPVQLSKNWHRQKDRRLLYEGPWFHGFSQVRLPPRSRLPLELTTTWARWGGVPAASHAQLCLIGWGWNQLWDEVAIGSWGESICYEPDAVQQRCRIDDVRPLMVWAMNEDRRKWSWTHNVGGGDFLVYYDAQGEYQPWRGVRTAYLSHGPNLTQVIYSGVTADGAIAARVEVSTPRCDDLNRAYHRLRYDVLKPVSFTRLAFYQLGSDNYHWHQYRRLARGNAAGLLEEWTPERGGKRYLRTGIPCPGEAPWFSLHDAIAEDHGKPAKGAWACRGLVVRSWQARLGGQLAPPVASIYGTEAGRIPSANLELSAPTNVTKLVPGDFVEALVELVILPMNADDYYGPNEALRVSLTGTANTWKPVHRQAAGNRLEVRAVKGKLVADYPPLVSVNDEQTAELEIHGGVGFVPVRFGGLRRWDQFELMVWAGSQLKRVDQSVHGNDFWQADYDASQQTWTRTYNINLDRRNSDRSPTRLTLRPVH